MGIERLFNKQELRKPTRPRLACELSSGYVVAARSIDGYLIDSSVERALPAGALAPSLSAGNIVNGDAVRNALQEAIAALGSRSRDVIAVLPDAACRLALLDFDSLPAKREEADAVIRFRLKKSLPFDVDQARLSWQAQQVNGKLTAVAAVIPESTLEEYESVLRQAGLIPGVVVPSMLAALGQVDASIPTLVVKVDPATTSIAIADQEALLLIRTLDHPAGWEPNGAQLAEDVYPSLIFYQDTYGRPVEKILVSGLASLEELNAALAEFAGIRAQELVSSSRVGVAVGTQRSVLGAVAGALA